MANRNATPPAANNAQKVLTEARLARHLLPLGVRSRPIRIGARQARGYQLADFAEPFARFLCARTTDCPWSPEI